MIKQSNNDIDVSIIIPTYKREELLFDALTSLYKQTSLDKCEILVMDNACDEVIKNRMEKECVHVNIKYIPVSEIGLNNCRNIAIHSALGDLLIYIDDDVITPKDWLHNMLLAFENEQIVMVGGKTVARWEGKKATWIDRVDPTYFSLLDLGESSRLMRWPETPFGCNMAVRKQWAKNMNGFSPDGIGNKLIEWYRGDGESGFAKKIYQNEGKIFYAADAYLYHRIPATRLTRSFLYKRTIKSAFSNSFSEMREQNYTRKRLIKEIIVNIICSTHLFLKSIITLNRTNSLPKQLKSFNYFFKAIYQARLLIDSKFRVWVTKENYM